MAIYTLNIAKWRCGDEGKNKFGVGETEMLNVEGYSCCLGQFAKPKVPIKAIIKTGTPSGVADRVKRIYDRLFVTNVHANTALSCDLMEINDNTKTTVRQKIQLIRDTLKKYGHQLRVINQHLIPK